MNDSVKESCQAYDALFHKWEKTNVVYEGEDAVHDAADMLLPRLEQQTDEMYIAYVERARFFNAFKRTIQGLEGTVTRKEPTINIDGIEQYATDIDGGGQTLDEYAKAALHETLKIGVCGTLVDYSAVAIGITISEANALNSRPKLAFYKAENIINWRYATVNNIKVLTLVVLKEYEEKQVNEFETELVEQYRVLRITEGEYNQQVYVVEEDTVVAGPIIFPLLNGKKQPVIPFYFHGEHGNPPLYDLVTTNIKHYQLKADHNHALHYIGLPTPWRSGVDPQDKNLSRSIGPSTIWDFENENAKCGYLEFEGKGLDHITQELEDIKQDMAFLGAAMLSSDQMQNETATKANFRNASETSALASIVINLSATITLSLQHFAIWSGQQETSDIEYSFSIDFNPNKLNAQELTALVMAWQNGAISKQTLYENLQAGEIADSKRTFEEEEALMMKEVTGQEDDDGEE